MPTKPKCTAQSVNCSGTREEGIIKHLLAIALVLTSFDMFAKEKPKPDDFTLTAHILSYEHQAFTSRVEAEIDGVVYILTATNQLLGHRCNASKMKPEVAIEAGKDYPAMRATFYGRPWFRFLIPDSKHPICDLEVEGTRKTASAPAK